MNGNGFRFSKPKALQLQHAGNKWHRGHSVKQIHAQIHIKIYNYLTHSMHWTIFYTLLHTNTHAHTRYVLVNQPALGICRESHYPVLTGPGKIINPSKFNFFQSKILNRIVDKNILCRINNIQNYKLVFCIFLYLLLFVHLNHRCLCLYLRLYIDIDR